MGWKEKIEKYCKQYDIPLYFLSDTLDEPKVIPMIRGKAFEFTIYEKLTNLLNPKIWKVEKPSMNAQLGYHDIDVQVTHIESKKILSIECKLASKGSCKVTKDTTAIRVKCMRSRTLGLEMVKKISRGLKISQEVLQTHNDQYIENNFDFVITSIGNAFYQTNEKGTFIFSPTENQKLFLENFSGANLQEKTFNSIYIACSKDISIKKKNNILCTRRKCKNNKNCGFIPNYPVIEFKTTSLEPINNWWEFEKSEEVFKKFLKLQ